MASRFSIEAVFKGVDRMSAPVRKITKNVGRMTRTLNTGLRRLNKGMDRTVRGLKSAARGMVIVAALTAAALVNIISTGAQFEQTLVSAAVKFPGEIRKGSEAYEELSDKAREVGRTTEFTASQAASGLNFLAMAGFDAESAMSSLSGVVDLATVAQIDLGLATDIATDSMGAFNLLSKDAATNQKNLARVSDILVKTSTSANTTIEDMFEALKQGAPVATAAGQSIETTAALIAIMANAGIKGTKAGTGLKNIMLALGAPGSQAARVMKRLGVETVDASGNIRDAVDVFEDFSVAVNDLPNSQKLAAFREIFGKIPIAAAINLTNASDRVREFRDELIGINGVSKEMAAVIRDTVIGRFKNLQSAIEAVKISIFTLTNGEISDLLDKLTDWVRANGEVIASGMAKFLLLLIDNFDDIIKGVKKATIILIAFGATVVAVKTLLLGLTLITAIITAPAWVGFALAIGAIGLAVGGAAVFHEKLLGVLKEFPLLLQIIIAGLLFLVGGPLSLFGFVALVIAANWETLKETVINVWDSIVDKTVIGINKVKAAIEKLKGFIPGISGIIDIGSRLFGGTISELLDQQDASRRGISAPVIDSPQNRIARSIIESNTTTTTTSELLIRDETGRAEFVGPQLNSRLKLHPTGTFN